MDNEEETAYAQLINRLYFDMIDSMVVNWKEVVLYELDKMRREMPYADFIEIRLVCERRSVVE